jgi:hypothetical protein
MKLRRKYPKIAFDIEVLKEANSLIQSFFKNSKISEHFDIYDGAEYWSYNTEHEFFTHYRKGCAGARFTKYNKEYQLSIDFDKWETQVTIQAPDKSQLDLLFEPFEKSLHDKSKAHPLDDIAEQYEQSEFSLRKALTSCLVTPDLLRRLEDYIINKLPAIIDIDPTPFKESYSISITDNLGTEKFKTISNFGASLFSNQTTTIELDCSIYTPKKFIISITFSRISRNSDISIRFESDNAKILVNSIYNELIDIINFASTRNKFYHPPDFIISFIFVLIPTTIIIGIKLFQESLITLGLISIFIAASSLFLILSNILKPYTTFYTRRSLSVDGWYSWFVKGFWAFLIFGTLAVLLRNHILSLLGINP